MSDVSKPEPTKLRAAFGDLAARPGRYTAAALGLILGTSALVAAVGLAQSEQTAAVREANASASTQVHAQVRASAGDDAEMVLPGDAADRVSGLNGVVAVGTVRYLAAGEPHAPVVHGAGDGPISIAAASHGYLAASAAVIVAGRSFDAGHDTRADGVAVLGPVAADRLGVARTVDQPTLTIDGRRVAIIGILDDVGHEPALADAVVVPLGFAEQRMGVSGPTQVRVVTEPDAGHQVAERLPNVLRPESPASIQVVGPPAAEPLPRALDVDVDSVLLIVGIVGVAVGTWTLAAVGLGDIRANGSSGSRRARRVGRGPADRVIVRTVLLGLIAGVLGSVLGVGLVLASAAAHGWSAVLDLWVPLTAPLLGGLLGASVGVLLGRGLQTPAPPSLAG